MTYLASTTKKSTELNLRSLSAYTSVQLYKKARDISTITQLLGRDIVTLQYKPWGWTAAETSVNPNTYRCRNESLGSRF